MNKKKILALCLIVCLLAIAVVGSTLAYFTDTDAAKNTMVVGNVDIVQNEQQLNNQGALVDYVDGGKLFPMVDNRAEGDSVTVDGYFNGKMANVVDKIITVTNEGSEDAYVRTIIAFETATEYEEGTATVRRDGKTIFNTYIGTLKGSGFKMLNRDTVVVDGVEYVLGVMVYENALASKETSTPSLKQFFLSPDADNEVSLLFGEEYSILAVSQAVQTAGFEPVKDTDGNVTKTAAAVALDAAFGNLEDIQAETLIEWLSAAKMD